MCYEKKWCKVKYFYLKALRFGVFLSFSLMYVQLQCQAGERRLSSWNGLRQHSWIHHLLFKLGSAQNPLLQLATAKFFSVHSFVKIAK